MTVPIPADRVTPDDERALQEVACRRCATTVLVRKNTPSQTSIQWIGDARSTCVELARQQATGDPRGLVRGCSALRESIEDAVREGHLRVLSP